ncbi:putative F-box domain-containing protein [Helianthus annuus]|nr:putative F-box domain-containing protein [Helianthus annuus]KAJ0558589.1 putative F-box domain-containing protein [Helianthus annuus]KAJ0564497.1 putative F-box domain-containing protein [Helianthus annuus]KAJ0732557.1 putative F-box domain-containing protein [Helianthus annuus]
MSDNITFDILVEILKRLPTKSLIKFRTVSKTWKSLIDGADFIAHYTGQQVHLLLSCGDSDYDSDDSDFDSDDSVQKYISIVDDNTFPQQKVSLTIPRLVRLLQNPYIVGCSNGLLCLYGDHLEGDDGPFSGTGRVVLWNLSIRKAVAVDVRNVANHRRGTVLGFGVCRATIDPKIVKITRINGWADIEVFTLSTGAWRRLCSNLPRKSIRIENCELGVAVNGLLYWLAMDADSAEYDNLIISYDMTSEEFREINLPHSIEFPYINKLRESLVVLEQDDPVIIVWMMEDGVTKSFTKLFAVNVYIPHPVFTKVVGFRKTGEPIIYIEEYNYGVGNGIAERLVVYEPYTKRINTLGISERMSLGYVHSYMESLLLLDQPS